MKSFFAVAAFAAAVLAQSPSPYLTPTGAPPAGCTGTASGSYHLTVINATTAKAKRAPPLEITLNNGILLDSSSRFGYIASNNQFQFDNPIQPNAIFSAGWSLCPNSSLALGPSTIFYECFSGSFGNLYNAYIGGQCSEVFLDLIPASGGGSTPPPATSVAPPPATSAAPPATSAAPPATSAAPPASQITDGQVQATTAGPPAVSQITDGQVQATTAGPVQYTGAAAPIATVAAQLLVAAAGAAAFAL